MNTENINIEDIKVGETYNLRVKVVKNDFGDTGEIATVTVDENGQEIDGEIAYYTEADAASFSAITPENGTKNSEPAPKYDPFRLFKKGDKVRVVKCNGRSPAMPFSDYKEGDICIVMKDEDETSYFVRVESSDKCGRDFLFCCLELVTPVEELEPYYVRIGGFNDEWHLWRIDNPNERTLIASFNKSHPHAKEAAEAECERLNAEHRKEEE